MYDISGHPINYQSRDKCRDEPAWVLGFVQHPISLHFQELNSHTERQRRNAMLWVLDFWEQSNLMGLWIKEKYIIVDPQLFRHIHDSIPFYTVAYNNCNPSRRFYNLPLEDSNRELQPCQLPQSMDGLMTMGPVKATLFHLCSQRMSTMQCVQ